MAGNDPRFGPAEQNCNVTREYLDELYAKADRLRLLERYLVELRDDPDFCCSIGGFDEWLSRELVLTADQQERLAAIRRGREFGRQRSTPIRTRAGTPTRVRLLTAREVEVLLLVADGMTDGEIATQLFLSRHTVVSHVKHVRGHLGARSRAHAVAIALRGGLIQ